MNPLRGGKGGLRSSALVLSLLICPNSSSLSPAASFPSTVRLEGASPSPFAVLSELSVPSLHSPSPLTSSDCSDPTLSRLVDFAIECRCFRLLLRFLLRRRGKRSLRFLPSKKGIGIRPIEMIARNESWRSIEAMKIYLTGRREVSQQC